MSLIMHVGFKGYFQIHVFFTNLGNKNMNTKNKNINFIYYLFSNELNAL